MHSSYLYGCEKKARIDRNWLGQCQHRGVLLTAKIQAADCWVALEPPFIANTLVAMLQMRHQGHVAHGTSRLYHSVQSLRDLHSLGPPALGV